MHNRIDLAGRERGMAVLRNYKSTRLIGGESRLVAFTEVNEFVPSAVLAAGAHTYQARDGE